MKEELALDLCLFVFPRRGRSSDLMGADDDAFATEGDRCFRLTFIQVDSASSTEIFYGDSTADAVAYARGRVRQVAYETRHTRQKRDAVILEFDLLNGGRVLLERVRRRQLL